MTRVVVQPQAIKDVNDIAGTIAANDLAAALRFYDAIAQTYDLIGRFPLAGSRRAAVDARLRALRSFGVIGFRNYLVFFLPEPTEVRILRVIHAARDGDRMMGPTT